MVRVRGRVMYQPRPIWAPSRSVLGLGDISALYLTCRQVPKLASGAKVSDTTQVMQSTITPASAPNSNINEKHFGPEPKTVDQARRATPDLPLSTVQRRITSNPHVMH